MDRGRRKVCNYHLFLLGFNIVVTCTWILEKHILKYLKVPPDRRSPSPDRERRHGHRMAPPPAQERFGHSSRRYNERDYDRISPQRRGWTRRERLEMDLEQFNDGSVSENSYDDEPMHRPPPHRHPRDYPPLPQPGNRWERESGYSIHLPLKGVLSIISPPLPPFFFPFSFSIPI